MGNLTSTCQEGIFQPMTHQGYEFISTLPQEKAITLLDAILQKTYTVNKIYKDDRHSFVSNIATKAHSNIMFKIPMERNNRSWERFLTLFRPNESFRVYDSMTTLQSLGIKGTVPLLAAHRKRRGMSVESFLVYDFVEGTPATIENLESIVETLGQLHQAEFVRNDPKLINFIVNGPDVYLIDFRLKRVKVCIKLQCMMNLCGLFRTISSNKSDFHAHVKEDALYHFAWVLKKVRHQIRTYRKKIKKKLLRRKKEHIAVC